MNRSATATAPTGAGRRRSPRRILVIVSAASLVIFGCGSSDEDSVKVFAASSLTDVFQEMIQAFADTVAGADVSVELVVAGSSTLVTQINEGAPADVVATASQETMELLDGSPGSTTFARNGLVIATEQGNPLGIAGLSDLDDGNVLVALCAPQVPCGSLARDVLSAANVAVDPATFEPNVRSVATKVGLGEVDAGLIYRTDTDSAPVEAIEIGQPAGQLTTAYPISLLASSPEATAFVEFVLSPQGSAILEKAGFLPPP